MNANSAAHTGPARPARPHGGWRRLSVNITSAERAGRIIIGLGAIIAGASCSPRPARYWQSSSKRS